MKSRVLLIFSVVVLVMGGAPRAGAQKGFTLEQVLRAPFPENLTAARAGSRVAWTFAQEGRRNIWVAEGPEFAARQLTKYGEDDGQEIAELEFSADGGTIVYVRGGEKNAAGQAPNPTSNPAGAEQAVWAVRWSGGEARRIDAGNSPRISARGVVAYGKDGQIWLAALAGEEKPQQVVARGRNTEPRWSPDGSQLAFASLRGDHSFIAVYDAAAKTVRYLAPSVDSDGDPQWSGDGKRIAFVRRPAVPRDTPEGYFIAPDAAHPWAIWVGEVASGGAQEVWKSTATAEGSFPYMAGDTGGGVLHWGAGNRLVFASEQDGWQHLYAISAEGGAAQLLTPGNCEVEQWAFSPDRAVIVFSSNCEDVDRRHLWRAGVAGGKPQRVTVGEGIEWSPAILGDGKTLAYLASDARWPGRPFVASLEVPGKAKQLAAETLPADFPAASLVVPQQEVITSTDGLAIHVQLFLPPGAKAGEKRPAVVFMHGGSMRQMLLGWHYMYYYSNAYAMNQYLASRGYVVLSLNYRSGVGYGRAFREAPGRAGRGASEYQDVVAAGLYLRGREDVDSRRIGLWGGSYGGYLTALGLARNSDLFAAGVDLHGVHDWPTDNWDGKNIPPELTRLAHESSPVTAVNTWRSPVLFVHGDDDRNVMFTQTVDLVARLRPRGVHVEQLIFPDEVHDFLLYRHWVEAYRAGADFFEREMRGAAAGAAKAAR
ncbi:MAG: prolyl oligopeptidase family serine peptidase [Acidobacteriia bacterium]|nr:prolyl oligopeptidase family serine peptidase [Terriglobia bacterium]